MLLLLRRFVLGVDFRRLLRDIREGAAAGLRGGALQGRRGVSLPPGGPTGQMRCVTSPGGTYRADEVCHFPRGGLLSFRRGTALSFPEGDCSFQEAKAVIETLQADAIGEREAVATAGETVQRVA